MRSLFIDTSTNHLRLALLQNHDIIEKFVLLERDHSKHTMQEIEQLFLSAKLEPNDIDTIYVINGPGSFTGLRIGVTIAKVYAYSLNIKVVPISLLKAQSVINEHADYYVSILKDKNPYVYAYIRDNQFETILEDAYITLDELKERIDTLDGRVLVIGDVEDMDSVEPVLNIPKIIEQYKEDEGVMPHALKPNYIKKIEVETK